MSEASQSGRVVGHCTKCGRVGAVVCDEKFCPLNLPPDLNVIFRRVAEQAKPVVRQMKGLNARLLEMTSRPDPRDPR